MASQYISTENQAVLWNTIQASPLIKQQQPQVVQQWFKNIIHIFYTQIVGLNVKFGTRDELHAWNKKTIQYMMADIKAKSQQEPVNHSNSNSSNSNNNSSNNNSSNSSNSSNNNIANIGSRLEPEVIVRDNAIRTESLEKQFVSRQQAYSEYLQKPPPEVDFRLVEKDEPISNIESLIKQHLDERDRDLQLYSPPTPDPPQNVVIKTDTKSVSFRETADLESFKTEIKRDLELFKTEIRELLQNRSNMDNTTA